MGRLQKALEKVTASKPYVQAVKAKIAQQAVAEEHAPEQLAKIEESYEKLHDGLKKIDSALQRMGEAMGSLVMAAEELQKFDIDFSEAFEAEEHYIKMVDLLIALENKLAKAPADPAKLAESGRW